MSEMSPAGQFQEWLARIEPEFRSIPSDWIVYFVVAALAALAIGLAVQAYLRSRDARISWKTLAFGAAGLGWAMPVVCVFIVFGVVAAQKLIDHHKGTTALARSALQQNLQRLSHDLRGRTTALAEVEVRNSKRHRAVRPARAKAVQRAAAMSQSATMDSEPAPPELPTIVQPPQVPVEAIQSSEIGVPVATSTVVAAKPSLDANGVTTDSPDDSPGVLPAWVKKKVVETGNTKLVVVEGGFAATEQSAIDAVQLAASELVKRDFADAFPAAGEWTPPEEVVRTQAVRQVHVERVDRQTLSSATPFHVLRAYQQIELSPSVQKQLFRYWQEMIVNARLRVLGALAGLLTLVFATVAAYFRLDDRTLGQNRRRLKLAAVSIIAAGGLAATLL